MWLTLWNISIEWCEMRRVRSCSTQCDTFPGKLYLSACTLLAQVLEFSKVVGNRDWRTRVGILRMGFSMCNGSAEIAYVKWNHFRPLLIKTRYDYFQNCYLLFWVQWFSKYFFTIEKRWHYHAVTVLLIKLLLCTNNVYVLRMYIS